MDSNSTDVNSTASGSPGRGPAAPLAVISATDQSGIVLIGTALCLIFSLVSMLIRLYIRVQLRREFSRDDVASISAVAVSVIQSALVFAQAMNGFGMTLESISTSKLILLQKYGYVSDLFYVIVVWLTKCSAALLFIRLSPYKRHTVSSMVCLVLSSVITVISLFVLALRCDLGQPWIFIGAQCAGLFWRWETVTVLDILIEVALLAVAVFMAQGLQLPLKKKLIVLTAFSLRAFVIIPSVLHLKHIYIEYASDDPTLDGVLAAVWAQIQISYAIIATTTPCLRPFMSALNTNYGAPTDVRTPSGSKLSKTGKSDNESYALGTLTNTNLTNMDRTRVESEDGSNQRSFGAGMPGTWGHGDDLPESVTGGIASDLHSLQSNDSRRMIIAKNRAWQEEASEGSRSRGKDSPGCAYPV